MHIKVYGPIDHVDIPISTSDEVSVGEFLRRILPIAKSNAHRFARVSIIDLNKPQHLQRDFSLTIKIEDQLGESLHDLLVKNVLANGEKLENINLRAYVIPNFSPTTGCRTRFNPEGFSDHESYFISNNSSEYPNKSEIDAFFDRMRNPGNYISYSARIENLGILNDNIPKMFLDPITYVVMDDPVIMDDFHTYDRSTISSTGGQSPFTRAAYREIQRSIYIRSEMETYIEEQSLIKQMIDNGKNPLECGGLNPMDRILRAYNILGISQNSTQQSLKRRFHKLALENSPDRGGNQALYIILLSAYKLIIAEKHTLEAHPILMAAPLGFFVPSADNSQQESENIKKMSFEK
jgi:hypothetical protein